MAEEVATPMEALEAAAGALDSVRRFVALGVERGEGVRPKLAFSEDEELALEDKVGGAIREFERAVERAREWMREGQTRDSEALEEAVERHEQQLKRRTVECRKLLVMYRQRAKMERMERARGSLMEGASSSKKGASNNASSASAGDVTAALKRTKDAMAQEIERVASVAKVLDDGRLSLQSSHAEFSGVNAEIASVRRRLKALQWQAQQDRMWIGAGIAVLAATVLFIVYERTGLLFI